MTTKPKNAFKVARDAKIVLQRGIRQGAVKFGGRVYTLTETRGEKLTRLWSVRKAQQGDGGRVS